MRCSDCGINYPTGTKKCGVCLSMDLTRYSLAEPISVDEAKWLEKEAEFKREYDRRERGLTSKCGKTGQPVSYLMANGKPKTVDPRKEMYDRDCLTPEELGAIEARDEFPAVREFLQLERTWRSEP